MQIVKEAYPDPAQFDGSSKYFDAASTPEQPRWFCVDVKLVRKLNTPITLAALKEHKDEALASMALFRQSRLSVQPVAAQEWEFVLGLEEDAAAAAAEEKEEGGDAAGDGRSRRRR